METGNDARFKVPVGERHPRHQTIRGVILGLAMVPLPHMAHSAFGDFWLAKSTRRVNFGRFVAQVRDRCVRKQSSGIVAAGMTPAWSADFSRWTFVTGGTADIDRLADRLRLFAQNKERLPENHGTTLWLMEGRAD